MQVVFKYKRDRNLIVKALSMGLQGSRTLATLTAPCLNSTRNITYLRISEPRNAPMIDD